MEFPSFVTGFSDGEACFSVSFSFRKKLKTGIEVRPSFCIAQHKRNLSLLKEVRDYFDCGSIRFSKRDQNYKFEARSIKDLTDKVVPHFRKYKLQSTKKEDFEKFDIICQLISSNHHRSKDYLVQIIELAYQMNESGKRKHTKEKLLKHLSKMKR